MISLKKEVEERKRLLREEKLKLKVRPTRKRAKMSEIQLIVLTVKEISPDEKGRKEKKLTKEEGRKTIFKKKPASIERVGGKRRTLRRILEISREACCGSWEPSLIERYEPMVF